MGIDNASIVVKPEVGIPVLPMLAQRLKSPKEMIEKMGKVAVEPKFDGLRVLIHFKRMGTDLKPQVWAFTRNLNNVFDIIYKDGISLMDSTYLKRREILGSCIKPGKLLVIDEMVVTDDPEVINEEYKKKIKEGLEGIVVKKADAGYIPGRTGWRWVKMKQGEEASGKLSDTVDCIVMGYYAGRGKRAVFGLGGFF